MSSSSPVTWHRNAAAYLISQNLIVLGSAMAFFAILWQITLNTASGAWMTYVSLATSLPTLLIALFAGVWADRYNRKWLLIITIGTVSALSLGLAALFVRRPRDLSLLLVIGVVRALGTGLKTPTQNALLPQLVPQEVISRMNGLNQIIYSVVMLIAPLAAGWLLARTNIFWIFAADSITTVLAIAALLTLRVGPPTAAAPAPGQLRRGLRYVASRHVLAVFMLLTAAAFILIAPASQMNSIYVTRRFGNVVWHLTANEWAFTLGSSLAGGYIFWRKHIRRQPAVIAAGFAAAGLCIIGMGTAGALPLYLTAIFFLGASSPFFLTVQTIYLQETVPGAMMGRVFALWSMLSTSIYPVAMLAFGPLADRVPISSIFVVTGALLLIVAWLFRRFVRQ